jgi:hypothetical protein
MAPDALRRVWERYAAKPTGTQSPRGRVKYYFLADLRPEWIINLGVLPKTLP